MEKITKLKELQELLSSGTINQEEFNQLKKEVMEDNKKIELDNRDDVELKRGEYGSPEWSKENKKRIEEINEELKPVERTIGNKLHDGFVNFLSLFVGNKTQEEQMAESAYRMSYDPWMKRAFKNFKDA